MNLSAGSHQAEHSNRKSRLVTVPTPNQTADLAVRNWTCGAFRTDSPSAVENGRLWRVGYYLADIRNHTEVRVARTKYGNCDFTLFQITSMWSIKGASDRRMSGRKELPRRAGRADQNRNRKLIIRVVIMSYSTPDPYSAPAYSHAMARRASSFGQFLCWLQLHNSLFDNTHRHGYFRSTRINR